MRPEKTNQKVKENDRRLNELRIPLKPEASNFLNKETSKSGSRGKNSVKNVDQRQASRGFAGFRISGDQNSSKVDTSAPFNLYGGSEIDNYKIKRRNMSVVKQIHQTKTKEPLTIKGLIAMCSTNKQAKVHKVEEIGDSSSEATVEIEYELS